MLKKTMSFDGTELNYRINKGLTDFLVFLHGAGSSITSWDLILKSLNRRGFSTLAIDLRGHGLSGRPKHEKDYSLENFAKDLHVVLRREGIKRPVIVGFCLGAMVITYFHKIHPTIASGYIFVDSTFRSPKRLEWAFNLNKPLVNVMTKVLERSQADNKKVKYVNYKKFRGCRDMDLRRTYADIIQTSLKSWFFTYKHISKFDGVAVMKGIRQPVLIVHGENDSLFDVVTAKTMSRLVSNSKLSIVPNVNHMMIINNPKALEDEIVSFASGLKGFMGSHSV